MNLTCTEEDEDKAGKPGLKAGLPASPTLSAVPLKLRRQHGAWTGAGQTALPGLGLDAGDRFRFTWWTTRDGDRVWVRHRGRWRAGVIVERGREYVRLEIETPDGRSTRVRKLYSELRRVK